MATIKNLLRAFVAIVLFSAFTLLIYSFSSGVEPNSHNLGTTTNIEGKLAKQWFVYTGTDPSGENTQTNYVEFGSGEPTDCEGSGMRCAILAEPQTVLGVIRPNLATIDAAATKYQAEP